MKNTLTTLLVLASLLGSSFPTKAQSADNCKYTEASELTLIGKLFNDIPVPYHRVDTVKYKGFTKVENLQVRESSGIACVFGTNSKTIKVKTIYGYAELHPSNHNAITSRGYDLYIKKDGKWIYARAAVCRWDKTDESITLISDMDGSYHECMLYLPLYSEEYSVKIGVDKDADIRALEPPFRHRVVIWGSSYTHGSSTTRSGATYPANFTRDTGIQLLSLGCSGNCLLQDYFCEVLCNVPDADAFIFDAFSNPSAAVIKERLFPFIEKLQAAQPGKPLIFQQTIYRESRNFSVASDKNEAAKIAMADSLMNIAVRKYKDVYFIHPEVSKDSRDFSVDATHPTNYGYTLWAKSIEKPVLKILKKYGIK